MCEGNEAIYDYEREQAALDATFAAWERGDPDASLDSVTLDQAIERHQCGPTLRTLVMVLTVARDYFDADMIIDDSLDVIAEDATLQWLAAVKLGGAS